jgi:hypothetical protein
MGGITNMRIEKKHLMAIMFASVTLTLPVKGFGPIAHYSCSPTSLVKYANLPDAWRSWDFTWGWDVTLGSFVVTPSFAWSHACNKKGQVAVTPVEWIINAITHHWTGVTVPEQPENYDNTIAPQY